MIQSILKSKYFAPIIVILIFWMGLIIIRTKNLSTDSNMRVSDLENKAIDIEKANQYIERVLTYIKTPEFLDREARIRLNYMAADEKVVYVYKDKGEKVEALESTTQKADDNMFQKIWRWLTNR